MRLLNDWMHYDGYTFFVEFVICGLYAQELAESRQGLLWLPGSKRFLRYSSMATLL
jgi:hypothetical protein